jgi:predicted PurR-regulated permease PerM
LPVAALRALGFGQRSGQKWLLLSAAFVVTCSGIRAAEPILAPTILGAYVATVNMPLVRWLVRRGVPLALTVLLVLLANTVLLSGFLALVVLASTNVSKALPRYAELLEAWLSSAGHALGDYDVFLRFENLLRPSDALRFVASLAGELAGGVWNVAIALIIATFLLLRFGPPHSADDASPRIFGKERARRALREVNRYVAVKTVTSMATGLLIGAFLWTVGGELPLAFGVLAFLLNYIPNLGSFAAAIPAVGIGLLVGGVEHALVLTTGYAAVNLVIGNLVDAG